MSLFADFLEQLFLALALKARSERPDESESYQSRSIKGLQSFGDEVSDEEEGHGQLPVRVVLEASSLRVAVLAVVLMT